MEIEKKGVKDSMEMVEKEVSSSKKMNHHRRGGIRTLPFILGKLSHIYIYITLSFELSSTSQLIHVFCS
jgi:hypothetical protein